MPTQSERPKVSIVVPCFNEEAVIDETYRRLRESMETTALDVELLFVDDGSSDLTEQKLRHIQSHDPSVHVVLLARNFGHQVAVTAGIEAASGDAVVLIDADLQDPPEMIGEMISLWRLGYDVVYGQRTEREGETAFKLATASLFYRFINRLSDTKIPLDTGDFRLMDRKVVDALGQMPERDRFLRGMISWVGFKQVALPYKRDRRFAGDSKYPITKMLRLAVDGLLSFSMKPLRLATLAGAGALLMSLVAFVYAAIITTLGPKSTPTLIWFFGGLSLIGGLQLVSIGILGEYVGRIYRESKQCPLYLVRERLADVTPTVATRPISKAA